VEGLKRLGWQVEVKRSKREGRRLEKQRTFAILIVRIIFVQSVRCAATGRGRKPEILGILALR
jgi:hypothetical protein